MSLALLTYDEEGTTLPDFYKEKIGLTFFFAWLELCPIVLIGTFLWFAASPAWVISWIIEYYQIISNPWKELNDS